MEILPSDQLARNVRHGLGAEGEAWLQTLPSLVQELCRRWQITLGEPFELSFNYVARARCKDGTEAVLKVGPWAEELDREIRTLQLLAGDGACRIFESDLARHAMLLERLRPGRMLLDLSASDDDEATRIGARVMRRFWRPVAEIPELRQFRPLAEWFRAFERHRAFYGGPGPLPERILEHAERLAPELLATAPRLVLLHADLHHYNILSADREPWLAIDPKGMLGDPGYEVGPFLMNPWPQDDTASPAVLARRLDILADELQYDRSRLRDWGIVHAVLSACWSAENDGTDWRKAVATAENLLDL
ncbi:MAG: aminoglycoside phosphotransferase family protein [Chloroflexota bacterium]